MDKADPKKALIIIDDSNLYYGFKKQRWEIDYEKFYHWLKKEFNVIDAFLFGGIISKKSFFDMHPSHTLNGYVKCKRDREGFFRKLKIVGYKVRHKPVASVYDSTDGTYKRKCNFDVEITLVAVDRLQDYEEFVLCSGDGDFVKLLKYLKGRYKKVTVIAHRDRLNKELEAAANREIFFSDIKDSIIHKKEGTALAVPIRL